MRAKPRTIQVLLTAILSSLVLSSCYGGESGRTWFNLPSAPIRIQQDGTAKVYGFNIGPILQPAQVEQFQAANIQKLDARIGYNGVHLYVDGQDLPYVTWDAASVGTLQEVVPALPQVPNGSMIAQALPWLRKIGLGAALYVPVASGSAEKDIPRWNGETAITGTPGEVVVGPMTIGSVVFDTEGNASIEGVPVSELEQALGTTIPLQLDANVLALLQTLGAESGTVSLHPRGIALLLNEDTLPGIAYDEEYLARLSDVAGVLTGDPAMSETINGIIPLATGTDLTVVVSFTGEPAADTELVTIPVVINEDGTVSVFGLPVGSDAVVDAATLEQLQASNIQHLDVALAADTLTMAANGGVLPIVSWTEDGLAAVVAAAPMLGVQPELIESGLQMVGGVVDGAPLHLQVMVPAGPGAEPVSVSEPIDTSMQPPDIGDMNPPTIRLTAGFDSEGNLTSVGDIDFRILSVLDMGPDVALPPDMVEILDAVGANQVNLINGEGDMSLQLDGDDALGVAYDEAALSRTLDLATPYLEGTPLERDVVRKLVDEIVLPVVPAADVDIQLNLE